MTPSLEEISCFRGVTLHQRMQRRISECQRWNAALFSDSHLLHFPSRCLDSRPKSKHQLVGLSSLRVWTGSLKFVQFPPDRPLSKCLHKTPRAGSSSWNIATRRKVAPRHLHHNEDEWFYVIQGEYLVEVGSQRRRLKSGDSILGPREIPHAWAFVGNTPGRLILAYAPAGKMEVFFAERDKRGGTAYSTDLALYKACSMELLGPPLPVD